MMNAMIIMNLRPGIGIVHGIGMTTDITLDAIAETETTMTSAIGTKIVTAVTQVIVLREGQEARDDGVPEDPEQGMRVLFIT
jgi:hypothetical protein